MSVRSRWRGWRRKRRRRKALASAGGALREFVYLDDVSVYSLLASRWGAIATEFTDTETASLNSEVGGSVSGGGGFGIAKAELNSKVQSSTSNSSQVLRKAIIQTSFRDLRDGEEHTLALSAPRDQSVPTVESASDLESGLSSAEFDGWLIDPADLGRGILIEAEVELEADPIFRASAIVTTIREIMQENAELFGPENLVHLADLRTAGRMFESLLAGLIPVRGRLVDYKTVRVGDREVLVHDKVLAGSPALAELKQWPTFVVGVTERDQYWKDIRRVLFSSSRYTVFARLGSDGVADTWRPIKLADLLADVHPMFAQLIGDLGQGVLVAMETAATTSQAVPVQQLQGQLIARRYIQLLQEHHGIVLEPEPQALLVERFGTDELLSSVDSRRPVLKELTDVFDNATNVETSGDAEVALRTQSVAEASLGYGGTLVPASMSAEPSATQGHVERFIDAEIVAIYW